MTNYSEFKEGPEPVLGEIRLTSKDGQHLRGHIKSFLTQGARERDNFYLGFGEEPLMVPEGEEGEVTGAILLNSEIGWRIARCIIGYLSITWGYEDLINKLRQEVEDYEAEAASSKEFNEKVERGEINLMEKAREVFSPEVFNYYFGAGRFLVMKN